jgi:single-strand DNA-binding protein
MSDAKLQIFGNIGKIEASYTPNGKFVLKGSVAVNHGRDSKKITNWFNFIAWEQKGEIMNQMCEVGTFVYIEGAFVIREWTDKDGGKRRSDDITVSDFRVLGRGKKKEEQSEDQPDFMSD